MADPELAALRAARLNQLQQSTAPSGGNGQSGAGSSDEAEKRRAEEQMKRDLLATALEPAARERRASYCLPLSLILLQEWTAQIYSVPYCARVTYEVKPDRISPPADVTSWATPGSCQRATAHRPARTGIYRNLPPLILTGL